MSRSDASSRSVAAVLAVQQQAMGAAGVAQRIEHAPRRPHCAVGSKISATLLSLAARLAATASGTFAQLGLGSVEAKVLYCLSSEPLTGAHVGKMMGIDRSAICRAVQTLETRGLVVKDESFLKNKPLSLTPEGQGVMNAVNLISCEREKRFLAGVSPEDQVRLVSLLGRLMMNIPDLDLLAESRVFAADNDR